MGDEALAQCRPIIHGDAGFIELLPGDVSPTALEQFQACLARLYGPVLVQGDMLAEAECCRWSGHGLSDVINVLEIITPLRLQAGSSGARMTSRVVPEASVTKSILPQSSAARQPSAAAWDVTDLPERLVIYAPDGSPIDVVSYVRGMASSSPRVQVRGKKWSDICI